MRKARRIVLGKPKRERPLGIYRRRWEDDIKMYVKETRCEGVDLLGYSRLL